MTKYEQLINKIIMPKPTLPPELLAQLQAVKKALKNHVEMETRATWEQCKHFLEPEGWTWASYQVSSSRYYDLVRKYFVEED